MLAVRERQSGRTNAKQAHRRLQPGTTHALLHPQSIAVIGASTRAGSFGEQVLANMTHYAGRAYPVNARYQTIGEQTCYPNVRDLPEVPDCAVITAAREAVEEIVLDCAKAGVGGAIIFASGYAETGKEDRIAQQERLAAIARETGLRIVGPNCIGVVNALLDSRVTFMDITPIPKPERERRRHHQPVRRAGHGAGAGRGARAVGQPRADIGQFLRRGHGGFRQLPGDRPGLRLDRLRVRGHGDAGTAAAGGGERLGRRQAAGHLQDGERRAGRRRRRCRTPGRWPDRMRPIARCSSGPARSWWTISRR